MKSSSKNDEIPLGETVLFFGFICRGTLHDLEDIRSYIQKFTKSEITYQTKDLDYLWIVRRKEVKQE